MDNEPRLRFLLSLIRTDLDSLSEREWRALHKDLQGYLIGPKQRVDRVAVAAVAQQGSEDLEKECRRIQVDVRLALEQLVRERARGAGKASVPVLYGPITVGLRSAADRAAPLILAGLRDAVLLVMYFVLTAEPSLRIRQCPECKNLFYRVGKQRYCSSQCTGRAVKRRWRRSAKGRAYENRRRRKKYERKVRTASGQLRNVKVAVRPRRKEFSA
jgi:hypothetical protein